jgi:D-3-phosphoglycerate dehydrogenase / 2-oxoglutarate reductase
MKVLISDKLSPAGVKIFEDAQGLEVINQPGLGKDIEKLKEVIADVDAIAIRSGTTLTPEILACAKNLKVIGRAGIGVDNVDIPAASRLGIIVMNTPLGNMVTTAEHAISMMCSLTRNIPQATASLKAGKWDKAKFMGSELYQKKLGVIGCGNIGKIVVERAQGFKMKVIAFDPFLSDEVAEKLDIQKVALSELIENADYITVHTPLNDKTKHILNRAAFEKMKKGVYIINCARGGIVQEEDLAWAIENGIVAGAALDVFEQEPVDPNHPLLKLDKVICTPHLGASTEEAQENVSLDVANQIVDFLLNGNVANALNTASASGELIKKLGPIIHLGEKLGRLQGQLCKESPKEIHIKYHGEITEQKTEAVTSAILQGVLQPMLNDVTVNPVNAPFLANERGIDIQVSKINKHEDFASLIEVALHFKNETTEIAGTLFGKNNLRLVKYNGIFTEVNPEGQILISSNEDKPGVVGQVGNFLGSKGVNITNVQLGLDEKTKTATAFYSVQGKIDESIIKGFSELDGITSVDLVKL